MRCLVCTALDEDTGEPVLGTGCGPVRSVEFCFKVYDHPFMNDNVRWRAMFTDTDGLEVEPIHCWSVGPGVMMPWDIDDDLGPFNRTWWERHARAIVEGGFVDADAGIWCGRCGSGCTEITLQDLPTGTVLRDSDGSG